MDSNIQMSIEVVDYPIDHLSKLINPEPCVFTTEEAAKILKCEESTVKNLIHRHKQIATCMVAGKLRIREEDLKTFLVNNRRPCIYDSIQ